MAARQTEVNSVLRVVVFYLRSLRSFSFSLSLFFFFFFFFEKRKKNDREVSQKIKTLSNRVFILCSI